MPAYFDSNIVKSDEEICKKATFVEQDEAIDDNSITSDNKEEPPSKH